MEKIINEIMEWCQNDKEYLKELIGALQEIVNSKEVNMKYYVLCRRNGMESILKRNGIEQFFDTKEEAEEKAKEMRKLATSTDYFVETMEEL